ncbi:uncharacterized protein STEHIDRAFT_150417 [Stereum hirsutum FP-91666 SS1]|uniref:uncharacterized protein n=1 Tax=Stereum hirsutum (strain FP-91666) TaxID=721885 RepID=UPI000444A601|nr:uncharacterized protein STEHIDRAFT_150417 [Stereum hirsutum FP-91666 SS1]EIM80726.1 hypothetical protein STEHIDRAFT_150417 [Stereum hirsutum FP-91666 SS1]
MSLFAPSNTLTRVTTRSSRVVQPSESARLLMASLLANSQRHVDGVTPSIYTHPIQGTPGDYAYDNLRNWCPLTHSQWRDSKGRVLPYHCVQEAHVVSKSLNPDDKARLEVAWGLRPGQFDFNGPLNTIPLRANWHVRFDKKEWVFLPSDPILGLISKASRDNLVKKDARVAADQGCPLVAEDGGLIYKTYDYLVIPFGRSSRTTELLRMNFKDGLQYVELDETDHTVYKPTEYMHWPTITSTVHPFAMIWKAVTEFGLGTPLEELLVEDHRGLMFQARQIYKRWMSYADAHPHLLSPHLSDLDPSPPSNRGSRRSGKSSGRKRTRTDSDDGSVRNRPRNGSAPSKRARNEPGDVDRVPSLIINSEDCCTLSSYHLASPSIIDRPVRVAAEVEEDSDDDDDEYRPSALQPQRKFNLADWAKTASVQAESVIEGKCPSDANVFEQPRKPPPGPWKLWPPDYAHV